MPQFRIKNLLVDVVSNVQVPDLEKLCLWPTAHGCWFARSCYRFISCYRIWTWCPLNSNPCTPIRTTIVFECEVGTRPPIGCMDSELVVIDLKELVINPEVIKEVQGELDEVLKAVQERGVELSKTMAPQTKAQAEVLEAELTAALEEVRKLKGTFK